METEKLDRQLEFALEIPENTREQIPDLDTGYDKESRRWELIVQYVGDLTKITEELNLTVVSLYGGYAIITIPEENIERLNQYPEIIFIEKPRRLYFELQNAIAQTCVRVVQNPPLSLNGAGVFIAIIDSGERVKVLSTK